MVKVTKAGNVVGMTKAYAVIVGKTVYETNDLENAKNLALAFVACGYTTELFSSGGCVGRFNLLETV